jgi:itaconate CoA-transferase
MIQAEAGFLSVTGTPEEPVKAGCAIADIAAGMYAYSNILAALISRSTTGRGSWIDLSIFESMVEWMGYPLYYAFNGASPPERAGASHSAIYPYGPFSTGDGGRVMLAVQNEQEWGRFCRQVLQNSALASDVRFSSVSRRSAARQELKEIIETEFSTLTREQATERLDSAGIANARLNEIHEVWTHPQLKARDRWVQVEIPEGHIPALLPPGLRAESPVRMDAVPALGEHTSAILGELGFTRNEVSDLRSRHVV